MDGKWTIWSNSNIKAAEEPVKRDLSCFYIFGYFIGPDWFRFQIDLGPRVYRHIP